jgi:hypothetical protein
MEASRVQIAGLAKPIDEEIVVGKDVLELVAGAMYADPLTVYREYVQNAADALDEAVAAGATYDPVRPQVTITLDHASRTVRILDIGVGVRGADFVRRLTPVGSSGKRGTRQRGFRGVGRLAGLGYCQYLIFRSRAAGEKKIRELCWDGRALREKLRDPTFAGSLGDLIKAIATTSSLTDDGGYPEHFFEVEMRKVVRIRNDLLMNEDEIRAYLAQVAPVPFAPEFKLAEKIRPWLAARGIGEPIRIEMNDGRGTIYHRAQPQVQVGKNASLVFDEAQFLELKNSAGEALAVGWVLDHGYIGAMPRASKMGGIRLRMRDVQVGGEHFLAPMFAEPRFCLWPVGELHVTHPKIIPNARRDDFEHSAAYGELQDELRRLTATIGQTIRGRSEVRQRAKRLRLSIAYAENWIDIARRKSLHDTIRLAALGQATEHAKSIAKQMAKGDVDAASRVASDKVSAAIHRLSQEFDRKKAPGRPPAGKSKGAFAAVSAILSSTIHAHKAIPMAERVLAAIEGKL